MIDLDYSCCEIIFEARFCELALYRPLFVKYSSVAVASRWISANTRRSGVGSAGVVTRRI